MANRVCEISFFSAAPGSLASEPPASTGGVGNSLAGNVCIFDSKRSAATVTLLPPLSSSMRTSVSGSALTISNSFFAGRVSVPGFPTLPSQRLRKPTSRSVASSEMPSFVASINTLARIGIVFFRSTIPCSSDSSFRRSFLRTTSSMGGTTSRGNPRHARGSLLVKTVRTKDKEV